MTDAPRRWSGPRIALAVVLTLVAVVLIAGAWFWVLLGGIESITESPKSCSASGRPDLFGLGLGIVGGALLALTALGALLGAFVPGAAHRGRAALGTLALAAALVLAFWAAAGMIDPLSLEAYVHPATC